MTSSPQSDMFIPVPRPLASKIDLQGKEPLPSYSVTAPDSESYEPRLVQHASIPAHTTTYDFVPTSQFVTRVVSPGNPLPLATITLRFDCFVPDLVNTLITKADTDVPLGEFEMGMAACLSTVTMNDITKRMDDVVDRRGGGKWQPRFTWAFDESSEHQLVWTCDDKGTATCTQETKAGRCGRRNLVTGAPLAVLRGRNVDPCGSSVPVARTTLELSPAAHASALCAHILLSAVVVERRRLSRFAARRCST